MTRYDKRRRFCRKVAQFEKPEANSRRVAKNTIVLYSRMLAVMAVGLYTGRVLLQALGVADYGLQSVAGAVIGMITFLNGSLATASSRFLTVEMGQGNVGSLKRVFSTVLTVHFILACIFVILLETVGLLVLETKLNIDPSRIFAVKWVYQCGVVSAFLGITQVPYGAAIVAHERMGAFAWMAIYDVVIKLAVTLTIMFYGGDRLILYSSLYTLSGVSVMLFYRWYCVANFTEARYRRVFDRGLLKPIFAFAGLQVAAQTAIMLNSQGVIMLNQRYFGPTLIAAITIAATVKNHVIAFVNNFKVAANPQIIKLYAAGQYDEAKRMLTETILFSVYILLLLGIPLWFYSSEALTIWLGDNVPEYSPVFVKIIFCTAFFSIFDVSLYQILYAAGKIKGNAVCNILVSCSAFFVVWGCIHFFRSVYVSCIVAVGLNLVLGCIVKPLLVHYVAGYGIRDYCAIYLPSLKALIYCACSAYVIKMVMPSGLMWALLACVLIVVVNAIVIFLFVLDSRSRQRCTGLLGNICKRFHK